ncbi:MAG: CTP synthetase, partial [Pelagibacteraceae bacterium]|nr:CTP synthetase [Pelagibacteraceae bacterium]
RIESDHLKKNKIKNLFKNIHGILIPGGFGKRGTEGKIEAIKYARTNKIPFLGICYGMQLSMIEFARNVLKIKKASSTEFDKNCIPVVGLLNEWKRGSVLMKGTATNIGGTMRLGSYKANLKINSLVKSIYKSNSINERHRHRYEVNLQYRNEFEKKGLIFSGMSPDNELPEIIELKNHPWFIGVQFHPEFKSRPLNPHPLFSSFIKAAIKNEK